MTTTADRAAPPREDLCRSAPFTLIRATDEGTDGLTIDGYGAVTNSVTVIDSWEGSFEETIAPGAFKKSLRERSPKMQFDHGQHPLLGSLPLGRWLTAEEDDRGLHLIGRLTDNWLVTPFRDAIRDGGVEGMSFRFSVVREVWTDKDGKQLRPDELSELLWCGVGDRGPLRRTLREVKVSEAGPVVWPAYEDTTVGVRAKTVVIDLARLRDPVQRRQLAELVALTDADAAEDHNTIAAFRERRGTETVDAPPPDGVSSEPPQIEPQPTEEPASDHPEPGPAATEDPAGEHSADPSRPVNPVDRARLIKSEYRNRLTRLLAIQSSTKDKEGAT